jgi:hypothetical protein
MGPANAGGRVFEHDTALRRHADLASGLEKKVGMRFAAFHVLPGHDGIEAVKESRATQVAFGRCPIGRCGERPRQSTLREAVHELDRPGLERNASAEELLQAIGEFAPILADAKLRAEVVLD